MDYSKFVALTQRQIADKGRLVSLLQLSSASSDSQKPWKGTGAPSAAQQIDNVPALFVDPIGKEIRSLVTDTDLLKRATDCAIVAPIDGVDLNVMTHIIDGKQMRVEWVRFFKPGDTVIMYVFGLTR